jgi:hypothetical protein
LARARPEMLFLATLHYKMRRRPTQAWAGPSPTQKLRPDLSSGTVMGRIFSARKITRIFSARTKKCSGLAAPLPPLLHGLHCYLLSGRREQDPRRRALPIPPLSPWQWLDACYSTCGVGAWASRRWREIRTPLPRRHLGHDSRSRALLLPKTSPAPSASFLP